MSEQVLPFEIKQWRDLADLRVGDILLAETESTDHETATCTNCRDPDGRMFFYRLLAGGGRLHWITDASDQRRLFFAELLSAPCPICRSYKPTPQLDPLPDVGGWLHNPRDWTI